MYYVLTDDENSDLKKANLEDQSKIIHGYWAKNDPTPGTPFNEAMAEYFQRADYAYINLQTVVEKDGIKTDRGKVYILVGPPSKIERKLVEKSTIEIWRYIELRKVFTFEAVTTGVFKLIKVEE
jgi:GWxTD domain-containing protein